MSPGDERYIVVVMDEVRRVAVELAEGQILEVTRRGEPVVDPNLRGPIRIRAGPNLDTPT